MEQGFKIAIWMLCLIGHLQGYSLPIANTGDLGFSPLRQHVRCGNETFISTTDVEESCHHVALLHFIEQLELAHGKCSGKKKHINNTLQTLDEKVLPHVPRNTSTCELETKTTTFEILVDDIETFVQRLNSNPGSGK